MKENCKGDKANPENYRPISLLSPIGKIIEKILYKQMNKYFTKYNLYSKNQFGFRSKRSCNHAVAELTDYIRNAIDERRSGSACFIDLKRHLIHLIILSSCKSFIDTVSEGQFSTSSKIIFQIGNNMYYRMEKNRMY